MSRAVRLPACAFAEIDASESLVGLRLAFSTDVDPGLRWPPGLRITSPADRFDIPHTIHQLHSELLDEESRYQLHPVALEPREGPYLVELVDGGFLFSAAPGDGWRRLDAVRALWTGGDPDDLEASVALELGPRPLMFERADAGLIFPRSLRFALVDANDAPGPLPQLLRDDFTQPAFWCPPVSLAELPSASQQLIAWVEGHRPVRVPTHEPDDDEHFRRVEIELATPRGIRFLDATGRPIDLDLHPIAVQEHLPYESTRGSDGAHPILYWIGGDVALRVHPATLGLPGGEPIEVAALDAAWLDEHKFTEVALPIEWGGVTVHGAEGRIADLLLVDAAGFEHRPARRNADEVSFEAVPPGPYFVGPADRVRQEAAFRNAGSARSLAAGELVFVEWDDSWALAEGIHGRVDLAEVDARTPFLVPCYLDSAEGLRLDRDDPWISIKPDGTYEIPRGRPLPKSLALCSLSPPLGDVVVHRIVALDGR